jgi:hypothetical protein
LPRAFEAIALMYRVVLVLAAGSALGLVVSLGVDLVGWASGAAVWNGALGLSMLGHVVAVIFLVVSSARVRAEAGEGRRPAWAAAQAERNLWRVVPTSACALVLVVVAGWVVMAVKPGGEGLPGVVCRVVCALAAGVSLGAHGWEALSARSQERLAVSPPVPGRSPVAGRFSRVEPEAEAARESL